MVELNGSQYEGFLFDLDGTIVDTDELHYQSYRLALSSRGIDYVDFEKHVRENIGLKPLDVFTKLIQDNPAYRNVDLEELVFLKKYLFAQMMRSRGLKPNKGVIEFMHNLKNLGKKIAVVSRGNYDVAARVLNMVGVSGLCDTIVSKEVVDKPKPDPEGYKVAIERLGLQAEQCVGFENDNAGLEALLAAGVGMIIGVSTHDFDDQVKIFSRSHQIGVINSFDEIKVV